MSGGRFTAAIVMACACTSSAASSANGAFSADPLATFASDSAQLSIEMRTAPEQPPSRGVNRVELTVRDAQARPIDALSGAGHYVVSNVDLFMAGRWELQITIHGTIEDHAKATLQIP